MKRKSLESQTQEEIDSGGILTEKWIVPNVPSPPVIWYATWQLHSLTTSWDHGLTPVQLVWCSVTNSLQHKTTTLHCSWTATELLPKQKSRCRLRERAFPCHSHVKLSCVPTDCNCSCINCWQHFKSVMGTLGTTESTNNEKVHRLLLCECMYVTMCVHSEPYLFLQCK